MADRRSRRTSRGIQLELIPGARSAPIPTALAPMLPTLTDAPFSHPDWLFEPKLDGIRAITLVQDGRVSLLSRRGLDATNQYPAITARLAEQTGRQFVVDGEIVALGTDGRPSFNLLQQRINLRRESDIRWADAHIPTAMYVFDLLHFDGYDLRDTPLENRKELLSQVLVTDDRIQLVEGFAEVGDLAFQGALDHGFEGVVAKRRGSKYEAGKRSKSWLKVKATKSDDFVVGGYSVGEGGRADTFGALLVGTYDSSGELHYAAHVGSGFNQALLREYKAKLDAIRIAESPFAGGVPTRGRWAGVHGRPVWVQPILVAEVKYAEWTRDGGLRAPVFLRFRPDKPSHEVRAEPVAAPPIARPAQLGLPIDPGASLEPGATGDRGASSLLDQLALANKATTIEVQGHPLKLTNLDKELWPSFEDRPAVTKREVLVYLATMAPYLLPHLKDRPLTGIRMPNGIGGQRWFQRHPPEGSPDFLETVRLIVQGDDDSHTYFVCNNLATLMWLGQMASLELHSSYARVVPEPDAIGLVRGSADEIADRLYDYPDFVVFDLDPYIYAGTEAKGEEPALNRPAFQKTCEVAFWLKDLLDGLKLPSFVKTTGKTGLHIFVPILRSADYRTVRSVAETIALYLVREHPKDVTTEWSTAKRTGKIFVDWNQNARAKTVASIFSPRSAAEASVSMPLRWEELGQFYPTDFDLRTAPARLATVGDAWAGILDAKVDLLATLG